MGSELKDISEHDYRALEIESFSSIKNLLKGPKYYFEMKQKPFKGNSSTDFGTAIHHLLQGHKDWVAFMNKTNKEKYAEFEAEFMPTTQGEGVILQQSYKAKFEAIEQAFLSKPNIVEFIKQFEFEKAFTGEYDGVKLKGRVDGVKVVEKGREVFGYPSKVSMGYEPDKIYTLEIKTYGQGAGLDDFRKIAYARHYDLQAAMYMLFAGSSRHYFVALSTSEPYMVDIHPASQEFIDSGMQKLKRVTALYKKYIINKEPYDEYEEL